MAYLVNRIGYNDDRTIDSFGRGRVTSPSTLLDAMFQYNAKPLQFVTSLTGSGTVAKTANESSLTLTCTTASGDLALIQSKEYVRYQPGKSQLIFMTGFIGAAKANVVQQIGYMDNNDGMFFQMQSTGASVVTRTSTSGSPVDTAVAQASWNIDKMDGTGVSGITIDFTKTQIFVIDLQWLGVGRVRFGFNVAGLTYYCHQVTNANTLTSPYSNSGCLPVRWRITNTGTAATNTTMKAICCSVQSEGGLELIPGLPFAASNGVTSISVSTRRPILSIQPAATFNSIVNRTQTIVDEVKVLTSSGTVYWELVLNGALTGSSFAAVDATNSATTFDVAATAISGGVTVLSGYSSGGGDTARGQGNASLLGAVSPLVNGFAGSAGDILSVVATAFTGSVNTNAVLNFHELR